MLRLRKMVALLLLVIWTPAVSHCLIEDALATADSGCCESADGSAPDHSECGGCFSVEKGQSKTDSALVLTSKLSAVDPLADPLALRLARHFLPTTIPIQSRLRHPDDTPPVPPADLIRQASVTRPVRGPSRIA